MRLNRFLLLLPVLLAACSSSPKDERACPTVGIMHDLKQFADFGRAERPARSEFVAAARLDRVQADCRYEDGKIITEADLDLRAYRGPAMGGDRAEFPYFAAVLDQHDVVVSKQNMAVVFTLSNQDKMVEKTEQLRITIPNAGGGDGGKWRILFGFQLSPEQLAFNRGEFGEPIPTASPALPVQRSKTGGKNR